MKTSRQVGLAQSALPLIAALSLWLAPLPAGSRSLTCDVAGVPDQAWSATARKACAISLNVASDAY